MTTSDDEDEEDRTQEKKLGILALMLSIAAWILPVIGGVMSAIFPFITVVTGGIALASAVAAVVLGANTKEYSIAGKIGFILGLVYLILVGLLILFAAIIILLFILILAGA